MKDKRNTDIFKMSGVGEATTCQWLLIKIISFYEEGATFSQIREHLTNLIRALHNKGIKFIFWLGRGVGIREILEDMVRMEMLQTHSSSTMRYVITELGKQVLKRYEKRIAKLLELGEETEMVIASCKVSYVEGEK